MSAPLEGIKVLELGQFIAGPFLGLQLADLGAEVIKVERPVTGDPFRDFGMTGPKYKNYSHNFCAFNRNKLSVTLDLGEPRGQELFRRMAAKVDVVLQNYRPGVMKRLGIDYDVLSKLNPRLVYCAIAGFAEDGPYKDQPAYDAVGQAISGVLSMSVDKDDPRITGHTISDCATSLQGALGILAALFRRERTGRGSRVDISMIEASVGFMPDAFTAYTQGGIVMQPETRPAFSLGLVFKCADDQMVAIQGSSIEKFWRAMLSAVGRPDIADDPRFCDRPGRVKNFQALIQVLRPVFAVKPRAHWMDALSRADVPCAPVHSIAEAMQDPEVRHLGLFHEVEHAQYGKTTAMRRPLRIDRERESNPLPPPALGEHTDSVLKELGVQEAEIAELREARVI